MLKHLPVRSFLTPVLSALLLAAGAAYGGALPGTPPPVVTPPVSTFPGIPPACPPNSTCVPGTPTFPGIPPVTPPGTCGPGNSGAPCSSAGPATSGSTTGINVGAGNPINIITGNKYQREVDMPALPGVLGLEIVRHYNSSLSGPAASSNLIGRGWKLSYETDLYVVGNTLQIVQADGARLIFNRDPANPTLCAGANPADGAVVVASGPRGDSFVWHLNDGRQLSFNAKGKLVQILAPDGQFVSLQHDARGLLTRVIDPLGRALQLSYLDKATASEGNAFRGVQRITSPVGTFAYRYGSAAPAGATLERRVLLANLVRVDAPGRARYYHYENPAFPTLLTGISEAGRDDSGAPVWLRAATYGYDINGRANLSVRGAPAKLLTGPDGKPLQPARLVPGTGIEQVTLQANAPGVTTLTNSLGQRTVYQHGVIGGQFRLLQVRGPGCANCGDTDVRYVYDQVGRLTDTIRLDRDGKPFAAQRTSYDAQGRISASSAIDYRDGKPLAPRLNARYAYQDGQSQPSEVVRPSVVPGREHTLAFTYNARGDVTSVTERGWTPVASSAPLALSRTTHYRYATVNGRSLLTETDGPLPNGPANSPADSDITRVEWDSKGNAIVALTSPGNFTNRFEYDATGRLSVVRNSTDGATRFSYNARSELIATSSAGVTRTLRLDGLGNVLETGYADANGATATERHGYDAAGRAIWSASRLGILTRQQFDTEGKLLESVEQSPTMLRRRQFVYDEAGRLSAVVDPLGATRRFGWDARSFPVSSTDALGRVKHYRYDLAGHMQEIAMPAGPLTASAPATARFTHDGAGRLASVTAANGAQTRYLTDDFGRRVAQDSPDSGQATRTYDAADRIVASTDAAGNSATYEYDPAGRIVVQRVRGGATGADSVTRWEYAGRRLVAVVHPEQSERFDFDAQGKLAQRTVQLKLAGGAQASYVTRYAYDALGQLQSATLADGSRIDYRRNGQNQIVAFERQRVATPWLRWMARAQPLVSDLRRDLMGLQSLTFGNGVRVTYQRSAEGALGRIVHQGAAPAAAHPAIASAERILGIGEARAAVDGPAPALHQSLPGALGLPAERNAIIDQRFLWDVQGNLLHTRGVRGADNFLYDQRDRLVASASADAQGGRTRYSRYAIDGAGNRLLAQQDIADQNELRAGTERARFAPASNRWLGDAARAARYDSAGQPLAIGARSFVWDAYGRLAQVVEGSKVLAAYRYNHRGERVGKRAGGVDTHYLYQNRQLVAELDAKGRITRQYVHLSDQPVVVIDHPGGADGAAPAGSALAQVGADLAAIWRGWFGDERIGYLHNNHLGATEAVTDGGGALLWRASYSPFGTLRDLTAKPGFALALRLPGQIEDAETGLYYNDHRYYDPQRGQYLTPDPLGLQGSVNSYAYVANNPLKFIDPSGLVLFAFDGTGNDKTDPARLSNVARMDEQYMSGERFYITGPGTKDPATGIEYSGTTIGDVMFAHTGKARIAAMIKYLDEHASQVDDKEVIDIDITGFSRGSAQARDFANQIVAKTTNGFYKYTDKDGKAQCQKVNFRFMGLFDTVLSTHKGSYQLGIPDEFKYVAHAVALNEYRGSAVEFPSESILGKPAPAGVTRIERGFLGSHSDIGGGFPQQDLAKVAMVWMSDQAVLAGVKMDQGKLSRTIIANPVLHDKSANLLSQDGGPSPGTEDRDVRYTDGKVVKQRASTTGVMKYSDTVKFIQYAGNPNTNDNISGTVDVAKYLAWLNDPANGFGKINMTVQ